MSAIWSFKDPFRVKYILRYILICFDYFVILIIKVYLLSKISSTFLSPDSAIKDLPSVVQCVPLPRSITPSLQLSVLSPSPISLSISCLSVLPSAWLICWLASGLSWCRRGHGAWSGFWGDQCHIPELLADFMPIRFPAQVCSLGTDNRFSLFLCENANG